MITDRGSSLDLSQRTRQADRQNNCLYQSLAEADPEVAKIIEDETWRQFSGLELIASEVSRGATCRVATGRVLMART